ncbi:MAG: transcription elongation factor GreB [Xanthomonadales bacterium]|nr:transcription elongation factor GreB [Xanthomonadales bacterium]
MTRWRPPREKSSRYITAAGVRALNVELRELWQLRRRDVLPALSAAAAEGDRSENAEYIYRKKQLGEIDRRIHYLSKRLDEVEVVRLAPARRDRIHFGAWVTLEDENGVEHRYRIVGADEIDPARSCISVDSPLARALLGRGTGDSIGVELPERRAEFLVIEIDYPAEK